MLIVVGGMIGLGKSSVAEILGNHFNSEVFYESVDDNPILPLFYSESEEEILKNRYPFLLQLYFLNTRFKSIKEALYNDNNVLDRSIYEDWYFAKKNMELGRISELEMNTYEGLLENMLEELKELPKKSPDIMVYLKGSFETVMKRINLRGRDFESYGKFNELEENLDHALESFGYETTLVYEEGSPMIYCDGEIAFKVIGASISRIKEEN